MSDGDAPAGPASARSVTAAASRGLPLALCGAAVALWFALMGRFGPGIYTLMGPFALAVSALVALVFRRRLAEWLRPTRRGVAVGLLVGVGMTLATYPVYALAAALYPPLRGEVAVLYGAAHGARLAEALGWVLVIIVAEELLWRGALLDALAPLVSPRPAMALSLLTYCVAQAGTGSWIVTALALVCGTLWTLQRHLTRSVLSSLIAHLIWTPTVILLLPVDTAPP